MGLVHIFILDSKTGHLGSSDSRYRPCDLLSWFVSVIFLVFLLCLFWLVSHGMRYGLYCLSTIWRLCICHLCLQGNALKPYVFSKEPKSSLKIFDSINLHKESLKHIDTWIQPGVYGKQLDAEIYGLALGNVICGAKISAKVPAASSQLGAWHLGSMNHNAETS